MSSCKNFFLESSSEPESVYRWYAGSTIAIISLFVHYQHNTIFMTIKNKKYLTLSIIPLALAASIMLPTDVSAKKLSAEAKAESKTEVQVEKDRSCMKAFGHLLAPGWLKKHEAPKISDACKLPPGIGRLFPRNPENPDQTAPVISAIPTVTTDSTATITWKTDENANSTVYFGTTSPLDLTDDSTEKVSDSDRVKLHSIALTDLEADTTYYAVIKSKDAAGNVQTSAQFSFETDKEGDIEAPILSDIITTAGSSTINVSWKTNEPASSKLYYGTSSPLDLDDALFVSSSTLKINHSLSLSGLQASTTYSLVIESEDEDDNERTSNQFSVTTSL